MRVVVIYKSLSGFTKKYAKWISEALDAECIELNKYSGKFVDKNTIVIFGGSLHAIGINGFTEFKKKTKNNYKQLIVFAVGASPERVGIEDKIKEANFLTDEDKKIRLFYLMGGFDYSKLNIKNKVLMNLLKIKILLKKENNRTDDEKGMLASYKKPLDATRRENINEIIEYTKIQLTN